jgi:glycosyltransferase involved in cell wall biosynthesis
MMLQLDGKASRPMARKILLVSHEYPPCIGGTATYARELARAASEQGYCVEVFCPAYGQPASQEQVSATLTVTRFPGGIFRPRRDLLRFAARLRAKMRNRYDIVHGVDPASQMGFQFLARTVGLPCPFFLTANGTEVLIYQRFRRYRWLMSDVFRRAAHTVAVSRASAELLRSFDAALDPSRVSVVYHGLPSQPPCAQNARETVRRQLNIAADHFVVLTVARLIPSKGHLFVLRALARLPTALRATMTYLIAGAGDNAYRRTLVEEARRAGVHLVMLGRVEHTDLPPYYTAADVLALLSDPAEFESFGLVVLEAAAHGLPGIGSNVGGIPEVIADGETGLIVDPEHPAAVAAVLQRLFRDRQELRALGAAARSRAATFTWERAARLTYGTFERVLAGSCQPGDAPGSIVSTDGEDA